MKYIYYHVYTPKLSILDFGTSTPSNLFMLSIISPFYLYFVQSSLITTSYLTLNLIELDQKSL